MVEGWREAQLAVEGYSEGGETPPRPVESAGAGAGRGSPARFRGRGRRRARAGAGGATCSVAGSTPVSGGTVRWGGDLGAARPAPPAPASRRAARPRPGGRAGARRCRWRPPPRGRRGRGRRDPLARTRVASPKISSGPSRSSTTMPSSARTSIRSRRPRRRCGARRPPAPRGARRVREAVAVQVAARRRSPAAGPPPGGRAGSCRRRPPAAPPTSAAGRCSITWISSPCGKSGLTSSARTTG